MQIEPSQDYRTLLRNEFLRRSKSNPRYSLRRFAQHMGVSPATISGIFHGKRRLSVKTAAGIADQLNLDPKQSSEFLQTVAASHIPLNAEHLKEKKLKGAMLDKIELVRLAQDTYQIIADWYHYAILEMTFIPNVKINPRSIAKSLGCSFVEASSALERLKRVGLLDEKDGKWSKTVAMHTSGSNFPSSAMRRHHIQMLQKAKQSLLTDPIDKRDFTSMTMAIDSSKIPQAKKMITDFRRKLCTFLEDGKRERVFELTVGLFPLMVEEKK